jgi:ribosomal protein L7/L12
LVKLVSQKTGLAEEVAKTAVETVVGSLKEKLPAPIAEQIDSALGGAGPAKSAGDLAKGLGGILGGK